MSENIIKDYNMAEKLYGKKIISLLTGYNPNYVKKNLRIPEFKREIEKNIKQKISKLKKNKLLDKDYHVTDAGLDAASLSLYFQELDNIIPRSLQGEYVHKKKSHYGEHEEIKSFKKDRYRDIALKKSIKTAIRRSHSKLQIEDLKTFERKSKGKTSIIYAIDASGSMKGDKIRAAKKAGIALAFKAINNKDDVGLITFGSELKDIIEPSQDFHTILKAITKVTAASETNFSQMIERSLEMFPNKDMTKHLILLTDALPTKGESPQMNTLKAVSLARANNITISLIGIGLEEEGLTFAKRIAETSNGRFYVINKLDNLDKIILEDYYAL